MAKNNKPVIGIIGGKGKMGSVFASFFAQLGYEVLINDLKTNLTAKQLVKKSDIVIVSVPIDKTQEVIRGIAPLLNKDQLVMDFTSLKEMPINEMMKSKASVIGLHPMFGDSTFGAGQKILVSPARHGKWMPLIKEILEEKGKFILKIISPEDHDKLMSLEQVLVHFSDFAFCKALQERGVKVEDILAYATPAAGLKMEMAARLLSQDAGLYANIQIGNRYAEDIIRTLLKTSAELYYLVKNKDTNGFIKYFNAAGEFLGDYREKAQSESDWLIFQWLEKFSRNSRLEQKTYSKNGIAVLGPKNSYSHQAAEDMIKDLKLKNDICFMRNMDEIFQAVEEGKIFAGIVPLENLISGTIRETTDNLFKKNVEIKYEYKMDIHHCLAALPDAKVIKSIYSHPQGFYQCSNFIKKNYKNAELINKQSTSWSFDYVKKLHLKDAAVIASEKTAIENGFKILAKNIENDKNNKTTFVLITRPATKISLGKPKKVSIAFCFSRDSAGSLYGVLGEFANAKINLTKLESRPAEHNLGEYVFFVDFEGTLKSSKKTLKAIKKKVAKLKILGEY